MTALPQPLLVLVSGAVPGLGKSSLSQALASSLESPGLRVELFDEPRILEEPAFTAVIHEWRSHGAVADETLLHGASNYLMSTRRRNVGVHVLDSLFPYLPSLLS